MRRYGASRGESGGMEAGMLSFPSRTRSPLAAVTQQLAQLPDLHMRVNLLKPLQYALFYLCIRAVCCVFQLAAGRHAELKAAVQLSIDGVKPPRDPPELRNFSDVECS